LDQLALADEVQRRQQEIQEEERRIREEDENIDQVLHLVLNCLGSGPYIIFRFIVFVRYRTVVFCYVQVCPTVPGFNIEEPKLPKRKNLLSESEEPEGTESIRFTSRGLDQELIRQVYLGFAKGCEH
jgi:hypothetical protein